MRLGGASRGKSPPKYVSPEARKRPADLGLEQHDQRDGEIGQQGGEQPFDHLQPRPPCPSVDQHQQQEMRSEEHTSELQSRQYLVCRLLLEKKKTRTITRTIQNR